MPLTADDGVVAAAVEHDARPTAGVHLVVLDHDVVAPLGRDDAVVACGPRENAGTGKKQAEKKIAMKKRRMHAF